MTQKAGQKCTATRRILVPESLLADLREALSERLGDLAARVGDPGDKNNRMGPLSSAAQLRDARAGLGRLVEHAKIVLGDPQRSTFKGSGIEGGFFLEPILLEASAEKAADSSAAFHHTEVFGPVATLLPYDGTTGAAARIIAAGQGSLVSTVYSDDREFVMGTLLDVGPHLGRLVVTQEKSAPRIAAARSRVCRGQPRRAGSCGRGGGAGRSPRAVAVHAAPCGADRGQPTRASTGPLRSIGVALSCWGIRRCRLRGVRHCDRIQRIEPGPVDRASSRTHRRRPCGRRRA